MSISPDEEKHLYNLSVIPAAIISYIFIAIFLFSIQGQQSLDLWFFLKYFGFPWGTIVVSTILFSFEILYSRKTKQPMRQNIKRLVNRMVAFFSLFGLLVIILVSTNIALSSSFNDRSILILATAIWFIIWGAFFFRFKGKLKKFLRT